jgi:hypothetical protein
LVPDEKLSARRLSLSAETSPCVDAPSVLSSGCALAIASGESSLDASVLRWEHLRSSEERVVTWLLLWGEGQASVQDSAVLPVPLRIPWSGRFLGRRFEGSPSCLETALRWSLLRKASLLLGNILAGVLAQEGLLHRLNSTREAAERKGAQQLGVFFRLPCSGVHLVGLRPSLGWLCSFEGFRRPPILTFVGWALPRGLPTWGWPFDRPCFGGLPS